MKIWYMICLLFTIYSISFLFDNKNEVIYTFEDKGESYNYSIIIPLIDIFKDEKNIKINKTNDIKDKIRSWVKPLENLYPSEYKEILIKQISLKRYFVFKNHLWIIIDFENLKPIAELIFHSNEKLIAFKEKSFEFSEFGFLSKVNQIIVYKEKYSNANCPVYSKFDCLNNCIKSKGGNLSSRYYYDSDYNGFIDIKYENEKISEKEQECFDKCTGDECKLIYFFPYSSDFNSTFVERPFFSNFQFSIQFLSLTFLLLGISFHQLILKFVKITSMKLKFLKIKIKPLMLKLLRSKFIRDKFKFIRDKFKFIKFSIHFKNYLLYFKSFFLLIEIILCLILLINIINEYIYRKSNPLTKRISADLFSSNLTVVLCVPFSFINRTLYTNFNKMTLLKIEQETSEVEHKVIKIIYLDFLGKKFKIEWYPSSQIMFMRRERCIQITVYLFEEQFRTLFSSSNLVISFNYPSERLYILPENQQFNSRSFKFKKDFYFIKKIIKRSRLNQKCIDYNRVSLDCDSKSECIDKCFNKEVINKFKKIPLNGVINKNEFTKDQWTNMYPIILNNLAYKEIINNCSRKYQEKACEKVTFEYGDIIEDVNRENGVINLHYDIVESNEEEVSLYKLLTDLLNIQSIFFGLNIFKVILIVFYYFKKILKLKSSKFLSITNHIICSIGFLFHLYFVLTNITSGELIDYQFYKLLEKTRPAELIFCLNFNYSLINSNYRITYEYLDKITKNLKTNDVFKRIEYLSDSNEWIKLDKKTNFTDKNLSIEILYFLKNEKCFKIIQGVEYHRDQFYFEFNSYVLKILFSDSVGLVHFFTKEVGKMQFSKEKELDFSWPRFIATQELASNDINIVKNPLSFSYDNDPKNADEYLTQLVDKFKKKYKFQTRNLPLDEKNLAINDEIFDQYLRQIQNVTDQQTSAIINYQTQFATNYILFKNRFNDKIPHFIFSLVFNKKMTIVKYTKADVILNFISVFSIWLNLSIFDLHIYLFKIKFIFIFIYKYLLSIKIKIRSIL